MPDEEWWSSFFDADRSLELLLANGLDEPGHVVEFGCGYGTFTLPAARRTKGIVSALDIDAEMVGSVRQKAKGQGIANIDAVLRDFVARGTGLGDGSQSHAMIFNLLHLEHPVALLREAHRVLRPGGTLSVMHWRSDISTPRGPSLEIRPSPAQCAAWIREAGLGDVKHVDLQACCPFHFGLTATR